MGSDIYYIVERKVQDKWYPCVPTLGKEDKPTSFTIDFCEDWAGQVTCRGTYTHKDIYDRVCQAIISPPRCLVVDRYLSGYKGSYDDGAYDKSIYPHREMRNCTPSVAQEIMADFDEHFYWQLVMGDFDEIYKTTLIEVDDNEEVTKTPIKETAYYGLLKDIEDNMKLAQSCCPGTDVRIIYINE